MVFKKCSVCCCRSSSRWFSVSVNDLPSVKNCFGVSLEERGNLCASCRRTLGRWKENGKKHNGLLNSKGKAAIKRCNLAKKNRRECLKNQTIKDSEELPPFCRLPLDVFVVIGEFLDARSLAQLDSTCHQVRQLCRLSWLALLRRDFSDKYKFVDKSSPRSTYKLLHTIHQSEKNQVQQHRKAMRELSQQLKTSGEQLDKVSAELRTTSQELGESQKTTERLSERLQQTARLQLKASQAEKLQMDRDPLTPVTKLQDEVTI